jgi:predicted transposase/invertase (TIGR01784 family)
MNKLISDVITVLLDRLKVPEEEIAAVTDRIEKKEYQTMFDALVENVLADRSMAQEEGRKEGRTEGIQIGEEKAYRERLESARKLKAGGVPVQTIAESLTLSVDAVESL